MRSLFSALLISFLLANKIFPQAVSPHSLSDDSTFSPKLSEPPREFIHRVRIFPGRDTSVVIEKKSTGKAMLFSALLPGLGQIYTRSYWKLPIIWGLGGYYIHEWTKNNDSYREFRDQYLKSINPSSPQGNLQTKAFRDFYRDQRDSFAWYFGILYLANIIDAYVSASLYEFDMSDDLGIRIGGAGQAVTIRWRW